MKKAGVKPGRVSSEDYAKFREVLALKDIRLMIYSLRYKGPEMSHTIYLYHYEDHYCVISSMTAFVNRSYFCDS